MSNLQMMVIRSCKEFSKCFWKYSTLQVFLYLFHRNEQNYDKDPQVQHSLQTNSANEGSALSIHGSYSYKENDGKVYSVDYIADENGFQHIGDHIPLDNSTAPLPEDGFIIVPDIAPNAVLSLLGWYVVECILYLPANKKRMKFRMSNECLIEF